MSTGKVEATNVAMLSGKLVCGDAGWGLEMQSGTVSLETNGIEIPQDADGRHAILVGQMRRNSLRAIRTEYVDRPLNINYALCSGHISDLRFAVIRGTPCAFCNMNVPTYTPQGMARDTLALTVWGQYVSAIKKINLSFPLSVSGHLVVVNGVSGYNLSVYVDRFTCIA
ncbi:hypothetical protein SAMN02746041_03323 [Desulfacinum hydrothermale DSM 13146]|uniref:Uncharacterized protein n=1 Tax=Desulfacinum hydrothermale DSM 13146 TaxID=1121390 RepID=A0A1W1XXZ7_9BACT|nr:hypothetical protein [Desulfacinum hydrothermale]SMC28839.1 hypothetical protein SAMN02746041_03323 [Desulfacinum hydrothermale DSM 13146]